MHAHTGLTPLFIVRKLFLCDRFFRWGHRSAPVSFLASGLAMSSTDVHASRSIRLICVVLRRGIRCQMFYYFWFPQESSCTRNIIFFLFFAFFIIDYFCYFQVPVGASIALSPESATSYQRYDEQCFNRPFSSSLVKTASHLAPSQA